MPVIVAIAQLPFLVKFPNNIWLHFIISFATAIPVAILLVKLVPETVLIDVNLGFYHLSRLEATTCLVSMLLAKLPYFGLNWIRGVVKNAIFSASFLLLLTQLSIQFVPSGFGFLIYIIIPFLLPLIYHVVVGNIKPFRILAITILSYISLVGLDYYFITEAKGHTGFFEGTYPGFLIIDYLTPVTFVITLLFGYNPIPWKIPTFQFRKNKENPEEEKTIELDNIEPSAEITLADEAVEQAEKSLPSPQG